MCVNITNDFKYVHVQYMYMLYVVIVKILDMCGWLLDSTKWGIWCVDGCLIPKSEEFDVWMAAWLHQVRNLMCGWLLDSTKWGIWCVDGCLIPPSEEFDVWMAAWFQKVRNLMCGRLLESTKWGIWCVWMAAWFHQLRDLMCVGTAWFHQVRNLKCGVPLIRCIHFIVNAMATMVTS